ncbi:MAG: hypothetical protein KatS3mg118_0054 [Paracoccaceae bacterium]|nr:MAG: hypothetical protein KatS3mg118_0054 [Paracoccaceae bacterium]
MRPARPAALLALALAACDMAPQTAGPAQPIEAIGDTPWKLASIDGEPVAPVEIMLNISGGFISGTGPCNTINANYVGEVPEFRIETLITTKLSCDRLGLENRVIEALMQADRAEIAGSRLTIRGDASPVLIFNPA